MKTIKTIFVLLLAIITVIACDEEDKFPKSNIALTPVYSVTNISNNGPDKINVYKVKPLVVTYLNAQSVYNFESTGYSDSSTETEYNFEWTVSEERTIDDDGKEKIVEVTVLRKVNATKDDGIGTMDVTATLPDGTIVTTTHNVTIVEEQLYN